MHYRWFSIIPLLLFITLLAMQFSNIINWSIADFVFMGIFLSGAGVLCTIVFKNVKSKNGRIILCGIVLLTFILVWAELAVGIFGSPLAGS